MIVEELPYTPDPWETFKRLYHRPLPVFLDSCGAGEYSFVACDPFLVISSWKRINRIFYRGDERTIIYDPFSLLKETLEAFCVGRQPHPLCGGVIGFLGYDLKNITERLETRATRDLPFPDMHMAFYDTVYIYHHPTGMGFVASTGLPEKGREKGKRASERLREMKDLIKERARVPVWSYKLPLEIASNLSKADYIKAVKRALRYIEEGDVYQINLSQRFCLPFPFDPLPFYGTLREKHPMPMGAFLRLGRVWLVSNSPERFLRIRERTVETMPIKGTVKRGNDSREDSLLREGLGRDPKEVAEHTMIVDLERNDLGRFCEYGSIGVERFKAIETYPTLHHMVSTVKGRIRDGVHPVDAIRLAFPGGSVTGAPKIRAMEIIDELEPTARGPYTGSIGYIDFCGNVDLNISIRTAMICKGMLFYQTGGGIVADSDPEREYEETLLKARGIFEILEGPLSARARWKG